MDTKGFLLVVCLNGLKVAKLQSRVRNDPANCEHNLAYGSCFHLKTEVAVRVWKKTKLRYNSTRPGAQKISDIQRGSVEREQQLHRSQGL